VRERMHVIQRGEVEVEWCGAVDTPASAVTHGSAFDGALLITGTNLLGPPRAAGRSRKGNAVKVPTSGQCHLAKKATPRDRNGSRGGVSRRSMRDRSDDPRKAMRVRVVIETLAAYVDVDRVASFHSGRGRGGIRAPQTPYKCSDGGKSARGLVHLHL
jgi:hypothetical protein